MRLARFQWVVAAALLVLPHLAGAQGLGDASKKEKDRREQGKAPKAKTYTQDELATLPPVANDPSATASDSAPPPAVGSGAPIFPSDRAPLGGASGDKARGTEAQWRTRVARAQARVDQARKAHETLAGMNLVPGYEYVDKTGRTVIHSIEDLQKLTARAKAELDAAEKAVADLLEDARREGVPPGWLR
jgi:type IV secretory pathway VirB10-like protein